MVAAYSNAKALGRFDHVTHLPNRAQLLEDISTPLDENRNAGKKFSVLLVTMADAQHFNQILRALGHDFSEDFIRAGVERLMAVLPAEITLYNVSILSFAVVVDAFGEPAPEMLAQRIAARFHEPIHVYDIPIRSRAGVGLVDFDPASSDPAETLRAALTAAQDSRHQQISYAHYDARTDSAHRRAFQILTDFPGALEADEHIQLYYQPRIHLGSGTCVGVEALVRWQHPTLGWISPGEFIPLVESTALIKPLTAFVLNAAIRQLAAWTLTRPNLRVSVNVSPNNLTEPRFVDGLNRLLDTHNVAPDRLELEFTEGAVSPDDATTLAALREVRALGVTVAIDDFGSGYSNMAYLTKIPADLIKIDKSFIQHVDPTGDSGFLIRKIVDLAHGLGFYVVGEGVETEAAYTFLADIGCVEAQGFHMSKPLPLNDLIAWLDDSTS